MRPHDSVPDFTRLRVAVVGDLIADHYVYAEPTRLSREAPVLVLRHQREKLQAGGAANVARNLWALGASTRVVGAVGRDESGRELLRLLADEQLDIGGVEAISGWVTPTKTRICAAEPARSLQQVLRIDREPDGPVDPERRRGLAERVRALAGSVDALLISDYEYGLVDEEVADAARDVCAAGATVVLDPRVRVDPFHDLTALTPNRSELARAAQVDPRTLHDAGALAGAARRVLERVRPRWLLVTLGNRGMALFGEGAPDLGWTVPASGQEDGVDPTGAGDTAAAAFTLALAAGLEGPDAMRLANAAAGVVVMENGTATCSPSRLRSALARSPVPRETQPAVS